MSRFISIPVQVGDAFYLERDGRSVLVDGGKSEKAFPELFHQHVNRPGADIVVCTHNDADHANGIIGFLESGMECREIWLPGRWLDALPGLLHPKPEVLRNIIGSAIKHLEDEAEMNQREPHSIEEVGAALMSREESRAQSETSDDSGIWPDCITDAIDDADTIYEPVDWEPWEWHILHPNGSSIGKIVLQAIEAGLRIRRIAQLALDNGLTVKWFKHCPRSPSGGIIDFLKPVSSRETTSVYPHLSIFALLALTTVNKESLVLYSPPDTQSPGVLFCRTLIFLVCAFL